MSSGYADFPMYFHIHLCVKNSFFRKISLRAIKRMMRYLIITHQMATVVYNVSGAVYCGASFSTVI